MVALLSQAPALCCNPSQIEREPAAAVGPTEAQLDAALVERFKAGDETAFTQIVHRHHATALAIALNRLRNHSDAEEIAADTFIRAHRALLTFRGESSLRTWLHRITVNLALNRYWYFFRRRRHLTQSLDAPLQQSSPLKLADLVPSDAPGPVQTVVIDEFTRIIAGSMERMDPAQRDILRLRNTLNHSYEEIADALGIKVGTVKSRIARARESLRVLIAEDAPELSDGSGLASWFEALRPSFAEQARCA
jgi:RNA polymerase sigma-70 factor (ECF subfamily)